MEAPTDAAIIGALPHRPPFRFVSALDQIEAGRRGAAYWRVTGEEDFFAGHFPGRPIVPAVLIGEALAQLAGLVGLGADGRPVDGRLARVDLKFENAVYPPAEIRLRAELVRRIGPLTLYDVHAEERLRPVARGSLTLAEAGGPP